MLTIIRNKIAMFFKREEGQGMVEYGLLIGLISVAAIAVIVLFGPKIVDIFQKGLDGLTQGAAE